MMGYIILILVAIYFVRMVMIIMSWNTATPYQKKGIQVPVSVIIPFRNEKKNLKQLSEALLHQKNVTTNVEFIFVDDQSNDGGSASISSSLSHRLIQTTSGKGKKNAIQEGVFHAQYEYIISLDADVVPSENWLSTVCDALSSDEVDLLILPVELTGNSHFQKLQSLEFMGILGYTAGTAMHDKAVLCNGANLACRKGAWMMAWTTRKDKHLAGGDDMFLLEVIKQKGKIKWLHSTDAIVKTPAVNTLSDLFSQRIRWSAKSKHFRDREILFSGALILSVEIVLMLSFCLALTNTWTWATFMWVLLTKTLVDFLLLVSVSKWTNRIGLLWYTPLLAILHPIYVLIILIGSLIYKPNWKDRKI